MCPNFYHIKLRKKSGVILNDPTGSGKTHQIVLFLNAVKCLLKQPILILCGAHEKKHWLSHLQVFTDFGNGVLLEPINLNTKKMLVCVNTRSNLASLVSHQWSIVVIDDDSAVNDILKKGFKTDFKIWMTSVDMKTNLEVFWSIYGWLCPKEKEMTKEIFSKMKETNDKLANLILIDAVMEDVVLRRVNGLSPFKKQTNVAEMEIKVTRKNKDVSGIKVKRTKIQTNVEKSSISNVPDLPVRSILDNVITNFQNDDINVGLNQTGNDRHRQEPMITNEDILKSTEPINNCKTRILDSLTSTNDYESEYESNESKFANNASQKAKGIQLKNIETSEIVTELISVENKPQTVFQVLNDSKGIELTVDKTPLCVENVERKNVTSIHKNIEETMKQMEEKALKKFKGSFLDSIF
ncbi:uncharacterized protein LOC115452888 isoform X2 [Manduca sexta]|uniref:uncharacterized protein LOC115452888 isoform X2 n=1 Tax=Manduca sexta TaxID=7130 RepID=UPI00188DF8A4|nr:uncharacterized protein LOC115452888 isoform X2 [Manduca sexta]XP_037293771.1 uncharacterized protein LOC115452888 isoform X2 [Manduca sexta]